MVSVRTWSGYEAKALRQALRLSVRAFSEHLGVAVRTISKWEAAGKRLQPRPDIQAVLDTALDKADEQAQDRFAHMLQKDEESPSRMDSALAEEEAVGRKSAIASEVRVSELAGADVADEPVADSDHDRVLSASWDHRGTAEAAVALSGGDTSVERRNFMCLAGAAMTPPAHQWLIRDPEPLASALSGGRISATLTDQLPSMITTLRTMDDTAGGGTVLSLARQTFGWVAGLLDQASYDGRTGRRLYTALAELGQLAGWVAHDAGRPGLGQRYHVAALHAAHSTDDRPLGAHILGCMADQAARHGRPAEAVTLVDTAVLGARGRATPRLLAELYLRKAYALATLQDDTACTTAVAKARTHVDQFEPMPDGDPAWLYWVSAAEITAGAGDCLLQLGQPDQATALLGNGVALFDESFTRDRQIYLTHLADALARPGKQRDLDAAAAQGLAAVQLTQSLASTRSIDCLHDLYTRMQPHAPVPAIQDFLQRAHGVLATSGDSIGGDTQGMPNGL